MHLVLDIFQGIGVAAAVGIRPFLPSLAVGALAAGDIQTDFAHTSYSFVQQPGFLLVMVFGVVVLGLAERRVSREALAQRSVTVGLGAVAVVLGALLFAALLAHGHHLAWPGWIAGAICAAVGLLATGPLLARVRSRLDAQSASALPLLSELVAVVAAALSVVAPGVGVVLLAALLWMLWAGRGHGERKYAGLRILR
ncbi:MAG: hypothetical protein ACRDPA_34150 [Solirubrobacteraceae bacterium]